MADEFKQHCIVELMGHSVIAGLVTEQVVGGQAFVRVYVPKTKNQEPYTKLYGTGAIYCLTPCDEQTAALAAEGLKREPMNPWTLNITPSHLLEQGDEDVKDDDQIL